jgi:putative aminopeptidase FrvX
MRSFPLAGGLFVLALPVALAAQSPSKSDADLVLRLAGMTAVTGYEQAMADTLLTLLPGATRDRAGNVVLVRGSGAPRRLAACLMDETGYVVGRVRPDGYLTLRRSPATDAPISPLFDQQLEGQRVTVFGRHGPIPGVVAVRSVHLTRGRVTTAASGEAPFSVDQALVDVGATSDSTVAGLGVGVLTPVALAKRPHRYGADRVAAPWAGRRAACAALLTAARAPAGKHKGTTVIAFVAQQRLGARGLLALATARGPFDQTHVADAAGAPPQLAGRDPPAAPLAALGRVERWDLPVAYLGTPVESVALHDVERLSGTIAAWLRGEVAR